MTEEQDQEKKNFNEEENQLEYYENNTIATANAKVPTWLLISYPLIAIWGLACLFLFFNGSRGYLDRGYWQQLQRAANTTMPFENHTYPNLPKEPIVPESELS